MSVIAAKFGGSCTADAEGFKRISQLINQCDRRRIIVLSAPGIDAKHDEKVTVLLEKCWQRRRRGLPAFDLVARIARWYDDIARGLGLPSYRGRAWREIAGALRKGEADVLSRGEYLCADLFSRYTGIPMRDAAELIAFEEGGEVDEPRTLRRIERAALDQKRLILPGFYGAMPDGTVATFPRNGSDITGALAAAGAGAALYENWTDVPGLMTADPEIVPQARLIPQISYRQMRRLARAGARVLHPECLDPVAAAVIPTRLRSLRQPECFGTLIDDRCGGTVPCIAVRDCSSDPDGTADAGHHEDLSAITVFGLSTTDRIVAAETLRPLRTEEEDDAVRFLVKKQWTASAARWLHSLLIV